MGKHSFLSASASHRWINCPPSARLCEEYADRPSEYAQEGTDCHELCAYKVEKALGRSVKDPTENLTYYSQEMEDCADGYCAFVMEEVAKARERCADPLVLVEQRLDYSRYVGIEGSFGTGDCVIVSDGLLHIIDYKHGLGVLVSAEKNSQLSCYALGALDLFDGIYDIEQVSLTIYQPRRENVSTYTMSREELLAWAETVLAPAAKLAYEGKGEFKAGGHCQFCKAKANCRKRAEYNLELARYDFEMPALLGDDEVAAILTKADELVSWAGDVKDYALQKALSGTKFTGFKVVEGRSNRKYTDEAAVAKAVEDAGYEPYPFSCVVDNHYMAYLFIAMNFNQYSQTAAQPGLAVSTVQNLKTCIPPDINTQVEIAYYLDKKCDTMDSIVKQKKTQLSLMQKHKASLICELVTGKKRIKEVISASSSERWLNCPPSARLCEAYED